MKFNLNEYVQNDENYKLLRTEGQKKVKKWERSGLLEGLTKEERITMAILIENQAKQLLKEASSTGTAVNSEEWSNVALPLVRRVFGNISAKNFVSVQPMSLPSGLVFWLEFKYATTKEGFTVGSGKDSQADSVYGVTNTTADPTGGLYGEGRFGYSFNDITSSALTWQATADSTHFTSASLVASPNVYDHDTRFSASYAGQFDANAGIAILTVATASLTDYDPNGIAAFAISGSGIATYFPAFTKMNSTNTAIQFVVSGSPSFGALKVTFHKVPDAYDRGDFEYQGTDLSIPELDMEMRSEPVVAKTRKLKAVWTPELAQDLNAYHSVDAEYELTTMMADYIGQEIDLLIISMLMKAAKNVDYWSCQVGRYYDTGTSAFTNMSSTTSAASAYTQGEWFKTLGIKVQKISNKIHQKTQRGGANWIVVSPEVATILESVTGYSADTDGNKETFSFGSEKIGTINNRFAVYKSPYMTTNILLMGYKGTGLFEAGAAYLPYIPLITSPVVYNPTNFTPSKAVLTRSAEKVTRGEYYGIIKIADLNTL